MHYLRINHQNKSSSLDINAYRGQQLIMSLPRMELETLQINLSQRSLKGDKRRGDT